MLRQNRNRLGRAWVGFSVALVAALAVLLADSPADAQSRWANYMDASVIREIIHRDGSLYIATSGGLLVYDVASGSFRQYTNVDGLPSNNLTSLAFDAVGNLYVGSSDIGVAKVSLSGGALTRLRSLNQQIDGLSGNHVTSLALWDDDIVYGSFGGAGLIVNDSPRDPFTMDHGLPSNTVTDVLPIGEVAWMATDTGVVVLDRFDLLRRPSGGPPAANVMGSDGQLVWVGTPDGVWTLDPSDSTWTNVGPAGWPIYSFHFDGTTMRAGATRHFWEYVGGAWQQRSLNPLYNKYVLNGGANEMRGLAAVGSNVYVGAGDPRIDKGFNLGRWDGQDVVDLVPPAPGGNSILRLSVDIDGSVWASFSSFWVGKLTPSGTWVNYNATIPESDSLSNQFANLTCLADSEGYKWFCTLSANVNLLKPLDRLDDKLDADYGNDEWEHITLSEGGGDRLGSLRLQNALEDPAGNRWFCSDDFLAADGWEGIHILSKDQSLWRQVKPGDTGLASGSVSDAAFGPDFAYLVLRHTGVQRWRHGGYDWANLSNFSDDDWSWTWTPPGAEETATSIAYRSDGVLWVGTSAGVYRFLPNGTPPRHFGAFTGFGAGLLGIQVRALLLDHQENLWVASDLGINRISRDDENEITAYSTAAAYQSDLAGRLFDFGVISPLVNARCQALALHRDRDILYIATQGGMSVFDFSPAVVDAADLSSAYVYPNPLYGRLMQDALKIENINGPVNVEIYTVEGELVHAPVESFSAGDEIWDLTTRAGYVAASGVYFVRISAGSNSVVKTIAVIR